MSLGPMTPEDRKYLRGYILRQLYVAKPDPLPETTLKRALHTLQSLPPHEELIRELDYLRDRGFITSTMIQNSGPPGQEAYQHELSPTGHELVTGEITDEHVWVM